MNYDELNEFLANIMLTEPHTAEEYKEYLDILGGHALEFWLTEECFEQAIGEKYGEAEVARLVSRAIDIKADRFAYENGEVVDKPISEELQAALDNYEAIIMENLQEAKAARLKDAGIGLD